MFEFYLNHSHIYIQTYRHCYSKPHTTSVSTPDTPPVPQPPLWPHTLIHWSMQVCVCVWVSVHVCMCVGGRGEGGGGRGDDKKKGKSRQGRFSCVWQKRGNSESTTSSFLTAYHQLRLAYTTKAKPTGKQLGSGTYGTVIELISGGEIVAGKVFKTSLTIDHQVMNKLCGELSLLAQVHHPNIVQCKECVLWRTKPYPCF